MSDDGPRRRRGGAWMYAVAITLIVLGAFGVDRQDPTEAERAVIERCEPLVRTARTDMEAWQLLRDQGYVQHGDLLYPPGCETVR